MSNACPLCGSSKIRALQTIHSDDVAKLFEQDSFDARPEFGNVDRFQYFHCENCDLRFFWPAVTGSERFYEHLQVMESYYQAEKPEFARARRYLSTRNVLLEVGCGAGAFGSSTAVQRYVGLEFSAKAAAAARDRGLTVLQETIEHHSRANPEQYDAVCAFQVLEHVSAPLTFLRSCIAALRPGGLMILSVPSADSFARGVVNFALDLPPHHVTRWSDRCLRSLAGLLPVEAVEIWHEPLQAVHRRLYVSSAVTLWGYRVLGRRAPAVDNGGLARFLMMASWKISKLAAPVLSIIPARGISVTGVYRKLNGQVMRTC
jgi:2-polyprenyl-3-methyl-5-hydroxy-6-metoxy-1,4-benzoquinol methylase